MHEKPNPIPEHGNRNLYCSHYKDCLNQAARLRWDSFACIKCHLERTQKIESGQSMSSGDTSPYFSLSPDLGRKTKMEFY
jgi:hypothetical protein